MIVSAGQRSPVIKIKFSTQVAILSQPVYHTNLRQNFKKVLLGKTKTAIRRSHSIPAPFQDFVHTF